MTGISRTSKHPELAIKLIELVNTNKELYNLICFGVEGKHYNLDENGRVVYNDEGGYIPKACWKFGNQFNAMLLPGQPEDVWEQTKKENETARIDPLIGFSFDISAIESEQSSVSAASTEFGRILQYGLEDPNVVYFESKNKQELAGRQIIIDEINRQLAEWRASQN